MDIQPGDIAAVMAAVAIAVVVALGTTAALVAHPEAIRVVAVIAVAVTLASAIIAAGIVG